MRRSLEYLMIVATAIIFHHLVNIVSLGADDDRAKENSLEDQVERF